MPFTKGHKINQERRNRGEKVGFQKGNQISKGNHPKSEFKNGNKIMLGRKQSSETKKKISESRLKNPTKPWLGKHLSEEHKNKLKVFRTGKYRLDQHPNWKGGKSFEPYSLEWTDTLKESIRERDGQRCRLCGLENYPVEDWWKTRKLKLFDVHHIDYDKKNCNPTNLITLCHPCHMKTNYRRDYWTNYFKKQ